MTQQDQAKYLIEEIRQIRSAKIAAYEALTAKIELDYLVSLAVLVTVLLLALRYQGSKSKWAEAQQKLDQWILDGLL